MAFSKCSVDACYQMRFDLAGLVWTGFKCSHKLFGHYVGVT